MNPVEEGADADTAAHTCMSVDEVLRQTIREIVAEILAEQGKEEYLSVAAAARVASVSPWTIRAWIKAGHLPGYRAGRVLRVKRIELDALMARPWRRQGRQRAADIADGIVRKWVRENP